MRRNPEGERLGSGLPGLGRPEKPAAAEKPVVDSVRVEPAFVAWHLKYMETEEILGQAAQRVGQAEEVYQDARSIFPGEVLAARVLHRESELEQRVKAARKDCQRAKSELTAREAVYAANQQIEHVVVSAFDPQTAYEIEVVKEVMGRVRVIIGKKILTPEIEELLDRQLKEALVVGLSENATLNNLIEIIVSRLPVDPSDELEDQKLLSPPDFTEDPSDFDKRIERYQPHEGRAVYEASLRVRDTTRRYRRLKHLPVWKKIPREIWSWVVDREPYYELELEEAKIEQRKAEKEICVEEGLLEAHKRYREPTQEQLMQAISGRISRYPYINKEFLEQKLRGALVLPDATVETVVDTLLRVLH